MERQLEPELMEDLAQVKAYALADFEIPHQNFVQRLVTFINQADFSATALDLGCGPGDICCRFARAFPFSTVHAVDGSMQMINYAKASLPDTLAERVQYINGYIPDVFLPNTCYDVIFSNSLLHHLPNPQSLWQTVKNYSKTGSRIAVMDLLRPHSIKEAQTLVHIHATNEPSILQQDFYHSLLAAFSMEEISQQLLQAELPFKPQQISDRHIFITGIAP